MCLQNTEAVIDGQATGGHVFALFSHSSLLAACVSLADWQQAVPLSIDRPCLPDSQASRDLHTLFPLRQPTAEQRVIDNSLGMKEGTVAHSSRLVAVTERHIHLM